MLIPSTLTCSLSGNVHTTIAGAGTSDRTTSQCTFFFREVARLSRSSHEFVAEAVDLPLRALIPALAPISWSDPHLSYFGTGIWAIGHTGAELGCQEFPNALPSQSLSLFTAFWWSAGYTHVDHITIKYCQCWCLVLCSSDLMICFKVLRWYFNALL